MDDAGPASTLRPRHVPARLLPVPGTVSRALQTSISNGVLAPRFEESDVPASVEEWRSFIAANDAGTCKVIPVLRAQYPFEMTVRSIGGVTVREITPASLRPRDRRVAIHFHSGGYVGNGGEASIPEAVLFAHHAGLRVLSVDYRMAPDHPFPAAIDDAMAVWTAVSRDQPPASIGLVGSSAGGGLLLALCLKLKALGLALPGALAPSSPWIDLAGHGDSYAVNANVDGFFTTYEGAPAGMARLYAGGASLEDPLISPVNGDFSGFPPSILTTGTRDLLLSDTARAHQKMRAAGVEARLEVHEAMSHMEYVFAPDCPESGVVFRAIAAFFDEHLVG